MSSTQRLIDDVHQDLLELRAFVDAVDALCSTQQDEPGEVVHALIQPIRQQLNQVIERLQARV